MENNILQTLSTLLSKNQETSSTQSVPLYPAEAYSQGPNNDNGQSQNNLIPLLLTLLGQNSSTENLAKMFSQNNSELANILSLFSNLNKKKKEEVQKKDETPLSVEYDMPNSSIL